MQNKLAIPLREDLLKEFGTLAPWLESARNTAAEPLMKKIEAVENLFRTTIDPDPKKARGVLLLLHKTMEKVTPPKAAPSGADIGRRMKNLSALEQRVDNLLAEFA